LGDAQPGDLVLAEKTGRPPRLTARVDTTLGDPFAPRSFSLIAIHKHSIPHVFADDLLGEAERVAQLALGEREDLTHIPIVAIDPADARDHDDAVWATPDDDPANAGGWKAIVAIADVSFYVRPGSALDKEARKRGNSVYFPDRVVPMLPEILSAHVCSLVEGEDRASLVCHLQVTRDGQLKSWRFTRARVRIAANIAYEDAQAAVDAWEGKENPFASSAVEKRVSTTLDTNGDEGALEAVTEVASSPCSMPEVEPSAAPVSDEILHSTLIPLWNCWRAMYAAREKRAPLDLDLPERRVMLDEKGRITSVAPRERLDAHKLIEDYMIAANVAAAKALEAKKTPGHVPRPRTAQPREAGRAQGLPQDFRDRVRARQVVRPATFNRIIERVGDADFRPQVMEQILRTQTQAYYGPQNHGHFGLSLGSYAHFTSPIRRYADLLVHRALVRAYRLDPAAKESQLTDAEAEGMEGHWRAHLPARAPRHDGRARDHGPLRRCLPLRACRRAGRLPHHRRSALRLLCDSGGSRRRRPRSRLHLGHGVFPL
jgi:ribonuclease R